MKSLSLAFIFLAIFGCSSEDNEIEDISLSNTNLEINNDLSYNELIADIGEEKLFQAAEVPNEDGALGRNKNAYFHVRFQINMTSLSDLAVVSERMDALTGLMSTIEYAFIHQLVDGSFEFSPPEELINSPEIGPLATGDLESGTAFYVSSLGLSLKSLQESSWFENNALIEPVRQDLELLQIPFQNTLDYLISKKDILKQYDATAPNRLLFDALAYYSLGNYLSNVEAQTIAFEFIDLALALMDNEGGYFIEGGGWDSSYNGVAVKLAMELYALIDDPSKKSRLANAIETSMNWQISRIDSNGEISTEGNTRVYEGGESFLGQEKVVDYVKTVKALYYFGSLTGSSEVRALGDRVLEFYN